MTTADWLGLICLAGLVGFFAGGFFVWSLFFKREDTDVEDAEEEASNSPDEDRPSGDEHGTRNG